jgi:sugar phosphate isomerase/epimerase
MKKMRFGANKVKLAVSSADTAPNTAPILLQGGICENLKKAHHLGYSAIEVHTRENVEFDFQKILDTCNQLDMKIATIVTGRIYTEGKLSLIDDDKTKIQAVMEGMRKYIDVAHTLKTDIIIGWVRSIIPDMSKADMYRERLATNIKELASYAEDKNVRVFIEAINRYETNYLNSGKETKDFIDKYDIPNTYVHLDTFHMNIEEENIAETIRYCGDKTGYIHFADSNRRYPGAGHLDFASVIKALDDINFNGYVSVECLPWPTGEEAARMAVKAIKEMF